MLTVGKMTPGSELTAKEARKEGKPCLWLDLSKPLEKNAAALTRWLDGIGGEVVLNVAGSRESRALGIHDMAEELLLQALQ